jgi:hypothetical protein
MKRVFTDPLNAVQFEIHLAPIAELPAEATAVISNAALSPAAPGGHGAMSSEFAAYPSI